MDESQLASFGYGLRHVGAIVQRILAMDMQPFVVLNQYPADRDFVVLRHLKFIVEDGAITLFEDATCLPLRIADGDPDAPRPTDTDLGYSRNIEKGLLRRPNIKRANSLFSVRRCQPFLIQRGDASFHQSIEAFCLFDEVVVPDGLNRGSLKTHITVVQQQRSPAELLYLSHRMSHEDNGNAFVPQRGKALKTLLTKEHVAHGQGLVDE